ncbi:g80 [Coccomyxa viridis]|uniref:G80 protein n=1 Tax=Coccomyxa viridis TaxID=1274662 RepID=A0ABP1FIY6_9CHLO
MTDANGWEAVSWSKHDLLAACNGDTLVPVEVSIDSGDYRDLYRPAQSSSRRQFEAGVPVPLSFLLEHIQQLSGESEQSIGEASSGMSREAAGSEGARLYLAQRDVSEVLPELAAALPASLPFREVRDRMHQRSVWLGPKGTQTPLHCDPYHNLLCQVWGTKLVRLYSPQYASKLHPFPNPFLRNTSQVDVLDPEVNRFPGFEAVPYLQCWLRQGQMLYIPRKWWHFVQAASSSLSISYWWTDEQS